LPETNNKSIEDEELISHLLGAKKKHDEDKNVESEEVQHLDKGADYLTTMLLQQGIKEVKTKSKKTPPKLDELKKMFVENLVKSGYVTLGENGRTILTDNGKKHLDAQTKSAGTKVELAKLKNLEYRKSLERKKSRSKRTKTKMLQMLKSRVKRKKK
jgi:Trm5-related predicted tRNA methylase